MPVTQKTILLVDDEETILTYTKVSLEENGYKVFSSLTIESAIEYFRNELPIDLILMDIDLGGGMDGITAAAMLLMIHTTPLIFLSNQNSEEIIDKLDGIASYGIIWKGSGLSIILASIKNTLKLHEERKKEKFLYQEQVKSNFDNIQRQNAIDQHAIVGITNIAGIINYVSDSFCEISGYSREELIGNTHRIINSNYHPKEFWTDMYSLLKKGKVWKGEIKNKAKDGSYYWVDTTISPIRNIDEKIVSYYAIRTLITDLKIREEELKKIENRNIGLLSNFDAGIIVHAPDTHIIFNNDKACQLLGLTENQMLGKTTFDPHWKFVHENNTPLTLDEYPVNQVISSKNPIKNFVVGLIKSNSTEITWLNVNGFPVFEQDGKLLEVIISIIDISQRKRTEIELRESYDFNLSLINSIRDGVSIIDSNGIQINANPAFYTMTGFTNEELIGKSAPFPYWPPEDYECINEAFIKTLNEEEEYFELIFMKKNGERFPVIVSPVSIKDNLGNIRFYAATIKDITERKHIEQKIRNYNTKLENLNASKNKFFHIIAHDLRNPFHGIIGMSEVLEKKLSKSPEINEESINGIKLIHHSAKSAYTLLENLMQWALAQTDDISLSLENWAIHELIENSVSLVSGIAFQKKIAIEVNVPADIRVYVDEKMVNTVIRNLLTNAIKFSHPEGKIIITSEIKESFLEISIQDFGLGIDSMNIEKIFKIDSKFTTQGTSGEKGYGLGLILCRDLIIKLGGEIQIDSALNTGSDFRFTLPLERK